MGTHIGKNKNKLHQQLINISKTIYKNLKKKLFHYSGPSN